MKKHIRTLIDKLYKVKILRPVKPVLDAVDAALFGTDEVTSAAPHITDGIDIKRFMTFVIIALAPAALASIYFYRLKAILIIMVSYAAGGTVEVLFAIIRKKGIHEGFMVTGLIFALVLPPTVPLWIVAVGSAFGVFFGKEVFGGTGRNIFNPALVGRLFITISFPAIMTTAWQEPLTHAVTAATPLGAFKTAGTLASFQSLLMGTTAGSMGETFRLGLLLGGLFLVYTRVSNWRVPFTYLGTVLVLSGLGSHFLPAKIAPPLFQLFSGGLLLGALFMATDPVTSPFTMTGKYVFGIGCGLFTILIRAFSGYVEGVMFSILLMNSFAPLIDQIVLKVRFKPQREAVLPVDPGAEQELNKQQKCCAN